MMEKQNRTDGIKRFFRIERNYQFEWNDLRALLQLINVILIIGVNVQTGSAFGLTIASIGLIKDLSTDRRINGIILHLLGIILNAYFLFFM